MELEFNLWTSPVTGEKGCADREIGARARAAQTDAARVCADLQGIALEPEQGCVGILQPGREGVFGGQAVIQRDEDDARRAVTWQRRSSLPMLPPTQPPPWKCSRAGNGPVPGGR
jgi:hypothetical protein